MKSTVVAINMTAALTDNLCFISASSNFSIHFSTFIGQFK